MYSVIIIDDEPIIKKSIGKLIELYLPKFSIVGEAEDGKEGVQLAEKYLPDLVITDIKMPEMDGLEVINKVNQFSPSTDFIFVSGYGEFDYAQHAIRHGAIDYLLKPIKPEVLINTMKKVRNRKSQDDRRLHQRNEWLKECQHYSKQLLESIMELNKEKCEQLFCQFNHHFHEITDMRDRKQLYEDLHASIKEELESKVECHELSNQFDDRCLTSDPKEIPENFMISLNSLIQHLQRSRNWADYEKINNAAEYIESRYFQSDLNLQEVAELVKMSPSYFSRVFKREKGISFIQYLTKVRMEKAKDLLNNKLLKVYEVALEVGYNDYPHFSKKFKEVHQISPNAYQKRFKG